MRIPARPPRALPADRGLGDVESTAKKKGSDWEVFLGILAPAAGERILDLGAGSGGNAALVLEASGGAEVYAIDPDEKRVAEATRDHPMVKSSVAGAESIPFPDLFFDKAYSTMALHHFADLDRALAEVVRVLKRGGLFVVLEVEPHSWMGRVFRFFGRLTGEKMQMMSEAQLLSRMNSQGDFRSSSSLRLRGRYLIRASRV